jgi:hypothetical protein
MASYHLTVKAHSRSKNANAVALASYRSGEKLWDVSMDMVKDCRKDDKSPVLHNELFNSHRMNREQLWNAAELAEKRKNSVVAREVEIALPVDIPDTNKVSLARDFSKYLSSRYKCAIDLAVHAPDADGDQRNYHAHILMTTREIGASGLGAKWRQLNQPNGSAREEMLALRKKFEQLQNRYLEKSGTQERVSCERVEKRDLPKKYVALPFKKYQVMRREGRVADYKEVSGLEEFTRWKSKKDLEIEDLAGEIEEVREVEKLEQAMDDIYYYDPIAALIDEDIQRHQERQEQLKKRNEDHGISRRKIDYETVEGRERSYREEVPELRDGISRREESESEVGSRDQDFERHQNQERSGNSWEGVKDKYRNLPGFFEGDVDTVREEFERVCRGHEEVCRKLDEQINEFEREPKRRLDQVRGEFSRRLAKVDQLTCADNQQAQQNIESLDGTSIGEQRRRAARILRRGSYSHAIERVGARIREGCEKIRDTVRQVSAFIGGTAVGGIKRYIEHLIKPAFRGVDLPEVEKINAPAFTRSEGIVLGKTKGLMSLDLPEVPILNEEKRLNKLEALFIPQECSLSLESKVRVSKITGVLKRSEEGLEILEAVVKDWNVPDSLVQRFFEGLEEDVRRKFIKDLDKLEPKGVKEEVLSHCKSIAKESNKYKSLREWAGLDQTKKQDRGRGGISF